MTTLIVDEMFVRVGLFLYPRKHRELFAWPVRNETFATVDPQAFRAFLETLTLVQWARSGLYGLAAVMFLYLRYRLGLSEILDTPFYFVLFWGPAFMMVLAAVWLSLRNATTIGRKRAQVLRLSPWISAIIAAAAGVSVVAISMV